MDGLVLRDRDTDSNGTLDERLYALQDANWNTTALVNSNGTVQERYTYTPFGQVTFRDGSGSTLSGSAKDWVFLHQGGERIAAGNYEFRNRVYSPSLGRSLSNDPLGFEAGDQNWYRAIGNNPGNGMDPSGLQKNAPPNEDKQFYPFIQPLPKPKPFNWLKDGLGIELPEFPKIPESNKPQRGIFPPEPSQLSPNDLWPLDGFVSPIRTPNLNGNNIFNWKIDEHFFFDTVPSTLSELLDPPFRLLPEDLLKYYQSQMGLRPLEFSYGSNGPNFGIGNPGKNDHYQIGGMASIKPNSAYEAGLGIYYNPEHGVVGNLPFRIGGEDDLFNLTGNPFLNYNPLNQKWNYGFDFNFMTAIPYRGTVLEIIVEGSYDFVDKFLGLNGLLGIKF